jgi:hypothetical protein
MNVCIAPNTLILTEGACQLSSPNAGGLTQPWATIIAAVIALLAASVAYCGIRVTISSTRNENRRKEDFEREEDRRKEKLGLLEEAAEAVRSTTRMYVLLSKKMQPTDRASFISGNDAAFEGKHASFQMAITKLMLYKFPGDIITATADHVNYLYDEWRNVAADPAHTLDMDKSNDGLRKSMTALHNTAATLM